VSDINASQEIANNENNATAQVVAPPAAAAPAASPAERRRFQFTGDGAEYFKIWIVNVLLTIVTLGIYSAWAKVRRLRYFYNNTKFAGSTFDFHGSPIAILKGRIIAVLLIALIQVPIVGLVFVLIYLAGLPWLLYRSFRFHMANTSYRNLRFNFTGNAGGAYRAIGLPLAIVFGVMALGGLIAFFGGSAGKIIGIAIVVITVIVFYLMGPYLQYRVMHYYVKGAELGTSPFNFHVKGIEFYVPYAIAFAVMMGLGVVMSVVMAVFVGANLGDLKNMESSAENMSKGAMIAMFVTIGAFYFAVLAVGPIIIALVQNMVWRGTSLHEKRFHSDLSVPGFVKTWMIVTLLTIITIGLYRPFAAVKLAKMRVEATAWTGSADDLLAVLRDGNQRAVGSEVADLMDVDFGI
jgi:uncharacterized membrane protein YjgN (DUF898 family)